MSKYGPGRMSARAAFWFLFGALLSVIGIGVLAFGSLAGWWTP